MNYAADDLVPSEPFPYANVVVVCVIAAIGLGAAIGFAVWRWVLKRNGAPDGVVDTGAYPYLIIGSFTAIGIGLAAFLL